MSSMQASVDRMTTPPQVADQAPLPRAEGAPPPRATVVASLRAASLQADAASEREHAAELGRLCVARGVHVGEAVTLLVRALTLDEQDDPAMRAEVAQGLCALGRHLEAGELLQGGGAVDGTEALELGLAAGDAFARAGDAAAAQLLYRELSVTALDDPRALERFAAVVFWGQEQSTAERAADAWIEAAARHQGSDEGLCDIARAFEIAPGYLRATEAYAAQLESQGRFDAADEVWREHGAISGRALAIATRRFEHARQRGAYAAALAAALDGAIAGSGQGDALSSLFEDPAVIVELDAYADEGRPLGQALAAAARTKSAMGRAEALAKVAARLHGAARGIVLVVAGEACAAAGNRTRARKAARQACLTAPWLARSADLLLSLGLDDDVSDAELETAIASLPARSRHHRLLASQALASHAKSGDLRVLALAWLRRAASLRPGDAELRDQLLTVAATAQGPDAVETLARTIMSIVDEPYPVADVEAGLARALDALTALDAAGAALIARQILDRTGPRTVLAPAIERAASAARDDALLLELVVRWAAHADGEDRGRLWLRAAELAWSMGDVEAAAAHLAQAAAHRADPMGCGHLANELEAALERLDDGSRSDARIDLAATRAWLAEHGEDDGLAVLRWRELASLRWDLAGDVYGAEEAWYYACTRDYEQGAPRYAADLSDRAGTEIALALLHARVARQADSDETGFSGRLLAAGARLALDLEQRELAAEMAKAAVLYDPSCNDAVEIIDRRALELHEQGDRDAAVQLVKEAYESLASGALGRFGVRTAHYRCARFLERIGAIEPALEHAVRAFEAVPSLGASYRMILRLVKTCDNGSGKHARQVLPRATDEALARLSGPEGARTALSLAVLCGTALGDGRQCINGVMRALDLDKSVGLEPLLPLIESLAADRDAAATLLRRINDLRAEGSPSPALKAITSQLYLRLSDMPPPPSRPPLDREPSIGDLPRSDFPPSSAESPELQTLGQVDFEGISDHITEDRETPIDPLEEAAAEERGDFALVAKILARRIEHSAGDDLKRLRLKRVAILDANLGDLDGATSELDALLKESEDRDALCYLAELCDRRAQHARAAKLWLRASRVATSLEQKVSDVVRCCQALLLADQPHRARKLLDAMTNLPPSYELAELRLAVAQATGDYESADASRAEIEALTPGAHAAAERKTTPPPPTSTPPADLAPASMPAPLVPSDMERRIPPAPTSRPRAARRATPPTRPLPPQEAGEALEQIRVGYALYGSGSPEEARDTVAQLRRIADVIAADQRDLHTFLLVEALEALHQSEAAKHELELHWDRIGRTPLVSLALAERLVHRGEHAHAYELFNRVIDAELSGIRTRGRVLLSAADAAHMSGDVASARRHLQEALKEADARDGAEQRRARWFSEGAIEGEDSLRNLRWRSSPPPPVVNADNGESLESLSHLRWGSHSSAPPSDDPDVAWSTRPTIARTGDGPLADLAEQSLLRELADGSYQAGNQLAAIYQRAPERRRRELLEVRISQARIKRGDVPTLVNLLAAARADEDVVYSRAIDHVLGVFRGHDAPPAPLLEDLPVVAEATTRLLLSPLDGTVNEALAMLCRAGYGRREMTDYDLSGTDRVPPGSPTPLGQLVGTLTRLLNLEGVRVFHQRRIGPLSSKVALLSPLAAVINGATEQASPILRYTLGGAMIAATPPCAFAEGMEQQRLHGLLQALLAAFGPVQRDSIMTRNPDMMRIAQDLWNIVKGADERKIRDLCTDGSRVTASIAQRNAARVRRRGGLFASGDLLTAIAQTAAELDLPIALPLRGSEGLRELCAHPDIADLYDLAIQHEYSECRWRRGTTPPPPKRMG
jgi:hypothetical protein